MYHYAVSRYDVYRRYPQFVDRGLQVGANARRVYKERKLFHGAKYPPIPLAFYPGFNQAMFFVVMIWLVAGVGVDIRTRERKPLRSQMREMMKLWFKEKIDPPSYYSQKLYLPSRLADSGHYLTRYETKNGLFHALNTVTPSPYSESEMNNKVLFAKCCSNSGIAHAHTLLTISNGRIDWHCKPSELEVDLFCKRKRGMGANGAMGFNYTKPGVYTDDVGRELSSDNLLFLLAEQSLSHPLLVQRRLKNHPEIADLAEDSLIAIRVVTAINEAGSIEVTHAMLRVLTELEPKWQPMRDEEMAAPIDVMTGELGVLSGDSMSTTHLRYADHPVTGAKIAGRKIKLWPAIHDLAIKAHETFPHRLLIGWDIALTPDGPIVLEGNTNFDVMLLQRVQDAPIGLTRLGSIINCHLQTTLDR